MSHIPLNEIERRPQEDEFDEMRIKKEEERKNQIKNLDKINNTTLTNEGDLIKKCINCQTKGLNHMNRHFCSPECAYSHYKIGLELNPYKPKGGKTKKRRTKKTKRRKGKVIKSKRKNIQ